MQAMQIGDEVGKPKFARKGRIVATRKERGELVEVLVRWDAKHFTWEKPEEIYRSE